MPLRIDLVRPDDLLSLRVECENLRLDAQDPSLPALVVENPDRPAFLIVQLPPQTVAEQAFFESSPLSPPPGQPPSQPPDPPGQPPVTLPASARMGGPSRLVLRVPPDARIPYTTEGLLGWGGWELSVTPAAAIPPAPSAEQLGDRPAIRAPERLETAIELPYRLVLSPGADAAWDHRLRPATSRGRTELWHTRLARTRDGQIVPVSRNSPAPLRAIWSPDYVAQTADSGLWPKLGQPDPGWGALAAMTPRDRHELVILTSGFRGFQDADGDGYVPQPVFAERLFLSALGGWLTSRGGWDPPYERLPWFVPERPVLWDRYTRIFRGAGLRRADPQGIAQEAQQAAAAMSPAQSASLSAAAALARLRPGVMSRFGEHLNISEWAHNATQGRDHFVKIVYEGTLYETGHRAALVKITERKIKDVDGRPVAALFQRMFIVVRQPRREYPPSRLEHNGRGLPLHSATLTTLVTPDIDIPVPLPGTEYSFWVRVGGQDFPFAGVAEDIEGGQFGFSKHMIFVPNADEDQIPTVRRRHLESPAARRAALVPGQPISYAPRGGSENTTFATRALYFDTHPAPGELYMPKLLRADVQVPAVEQILGTDAPASIAYWQGYLEDNVANPSGTFAIIAKEVVKDGLAAVEQATIAAPFSADKAGGIATPDLSVSSLSRALGPLAGDVAKGAADDFDPQDFFKDVKDAAKLFGSFRLVDLLLGGSTATGAPKVRLTTEPVDGRPLAKKLVASLDWQPGIRPVDLVLVRFLPGPQTKLEITGRIERVVEVPPPPTPAETVSKFAGVLNDFVVDILRVVEVRFVSFSFTAETGKKPDVGVELDPVSPVVFKEDLEFVETLRELIPPGLLGDGPSLDIDKSRIRAGFAIGIPPAAVGVFALKNITFGAAIELPFKDGKPLVDFSFSERHNPFNLTIAFLGGGGFFHIQLDTAGLRLLEAALEFGAQASIDLGVASGGVHIMAGIYFSLQKKTSGDMAATLTGYLRMGGELSVLGLISISLEFVLSFTYDGKAATGRATLTVKVEVLFFSASVEISVEKRFGGSSGDPTFQQLFVEPGVWDEYAGAFA